MVNIICFKSFFFSLLHTIFTLFNHFRSEDDMKRTPTKWAEQIGEVLYTREFIDAKVQEIAAKISADYGDTEVICVALLKGSFLFFSDLVRYLTCPTLIDFMVVSSYEGTESTGTVVMKKDMSFDITDKHVLIIEDLVDTGKTLHFLKDHLKDKSPASVKICTFLNKEARRTHPVHIDYNGIMIEDKFVVGYGMDYDETLRSIPFIGVLKPEVYKH